MNHEAAPRDPGTRLPVKLMGHLSFPPQMEKEGAYRRDGVLLAVAQT